MAAASGSVPTREAKIGVGWLAPPGTTPAQDFSESEEECSPRNTVCDMPSLIWEILKNELRYSGPFATVSQFGSGSPHGYVWPALAT